MKVIKVVEDKSFITIEYPNEMTVSLMPLPDFDGYCRVKYFDENNNEINIEDESSGLH